MVYEILVDNSMQRQTGIIYFYVTIRHFILSSDIYIWTEPRTNCSLLPTLDIKAISYGQREFRFLHLMRIINIASFDFIIYK